MDIFARLFVQVFSGKQAVYLQKKTYGCEEYLAMLIRRIEAFKISVDIKAFRGQNLEGLRRKVLVGRITGFIRIC